jgi:hypothetical protein
MSRVIESDKIFKDSPDVGEDCMCSRCRKPILEGVPIRLVAANDEELIIIGEYRFHQHCYFDEKSRQKALYAKLSLVNSGFGGIDKKGNIVDMRNDKDAVPFP